MFWGREWAGEAGGTGWGTSGRDTMGLSTGCGEAGGVSIGDDACSAMESGCKPSGVLGASAAEPSAAEAADDFFFLLKDLGPFGNFMAAHYQKETDNGNANNARF